MNEECELSYKRGATLHLKLNHYFLWSCNYYFITMTLKNSLTLLTSIYIYIYTHGSIQFHDEMFWNLHKIKVQYKWLKRQSLVRSPFLFKIDVVVVNKFILREFSELSLRNLPDITTWEWVWQWGLTMTWKYNFYASKNQVSYVGQINYQQIK